MKIAIADYIALAAVIFLHGQFLAIRLLPIRLEQFLLSLPL